MSVPLPCPNDVERADATAAVETARRLLAGLGTVHLAGIGGIGMAALARLLQQRGARVSGCDLHAGPMTEWLQACGIPVSIGHDPAHAERADWIIRTTALRPDHSELEAARSRGCPVLQRGHVLAALLTEFRSLIVCGTHGKTTTTALIVHLLRQAGLDPSYAIGGLLAVGPPAALGRGPWFVAEADESDGTLAAYAPDMAVVTAVEFDHAEQYADEAAVRTCFATMARTVRGRLVFCADDPGAAAVCRGRSGAQSYGFDPAADWRAADLRAGEGVTGFELWRGADRLGLVRLHAPGRHNVLNALAACAAAAECGLGFEALRSGLESFRPVRRRFERIDLSGGIPVVSDYAHHPTAIAATVRALAQAPRARWHAVFQPHRFSRTRALGAAFAASFAGVEDLLLLPVYAASEPDTPGGDVWSLYAQFRAAGVTPVHCAESLEQAWAWLRATLKPGDGLLIVGAGDVDRLASWARHDGVGAGRAGFDPADGWADDLTGMTGATAWRRREPLARHTTLGVGGAADWFAELEREHDLARLLRWGAEQGVPVTVLGAGSNVLVSDLGVRGVTVRLAGAAFRALRRESGTLVRAGAGLPLATLTRWLTDAGLGGLEFLAGIPGTLGGALRMNAGAWGESLGDRVSEVRLLGAGGVPRVVAGSALGFGYRRADGLADAVILEAVLAATPAAPDTVRARVEQALARRAWLQGLPSAGSVFRNPPGESAGRLLDTCGLKGRRIGGARVLEAHANVIVTEPGASASDVRALMECMRRTVRERTGVVLDEEIVRLE